MSYSKALLACAMTAALALPSTPMRAEPSPSLMLADSAAGRWSCRGLPRWERERCERDRYHRERRHERRRDKKVKEGVALGILGLAIGAMIAGAAKDDERRRRDRVHDFDD